MKGVTVIPKEQSFVELVSKILRPYQTRLDAVFSIELNRMAEDSPVRKACEYAMKGGGKRLRPALVWMVAEALGSKEAADRVNLAALAVEFFHISSLVTDDLPCMDNDDFRRGVPTTHKAFSEATAILASFALTSAGFEVVVRTPIVQENAYEVLKAATHKASLAVGLQGLIGGQYLDTNPPNLERGTIHTMIEKKTVVLFDLALTFGWLFGGGSLDKLPEVSALGLHFGRAFQILDDLFDIEQDRAAKKQINYAILFGEEEAKRQLRHDVEQVRVIAASLKLSSSPIVTLATAMGSMADA